MRSLGTAFLAPALVVFPRAAGGAGTRSRRGWSLVTGDFGTDGEAQLGVSHLSQLVTEVNMRTISASGTAFACRCGSRRSLLSSLVGPGKPGFRKDALFEPKAESFPAGARNPIHIRRKVGRLEGTVRALVQRQKPNRLLRRDDFLAQREFNQVRIGPKTKALHDAVFVEGDGTGSDAQGFSCLLHCAAFREQP